MRRQRNKHIRSHGFQAGLPPFVSIVPVWLRIDICELGRPIDDKLLSISSKLLTRSFTLPPLLLGPLGIRMGCDGSGIDVTGRRTTRRRGLVCRRGIFDGCGGAGCRLTSSLGWEGLGGGLLTGVEMGPRGFSSISGGGEEARAASSKELSAAV